MTDFSEALNDEDRDILFIADFNSPSHLDWTPNAMHLHCNWTIEWPVSKKLEEIGFVDSYRVLYPGKFRKFSENFGIFRKIFSSI